MNDENKSISQSSWNSSAQAGSRITDAEINAIVGGNYEYEAYVDEKKKIIFILTKNPNEQDDISLHYLVGKQYFRLFLDGYKADFHATSATRGPQVG